MANRLTQWTLAAVLAVSGSVFALRILMGPLTFPLRVNSPLNSEGAFGLAAVLLLLLRVKPGDCAEAAQRQRLNRFDALAALLIVAAVAAVYARTAGDYFVSDDFIIVKYARGPQPGLRAALTTGGGDGFFRPVTNLSFAMTARWAALDMARWHSISLAIHAVNATLVFFLAGALGFSRFAAGLASLLFVVHGTRPEAVVWVTGRFDLLATFFVLAGFLSFILCWDSSDLRAIVYGCVSVLCMVLGCLSKESAYALPLLLPLFAASRGALRDRRALVLIPFFAVAAGLFAYRWVLFGGIGGYVSSSGQAQALTLGMVSVVKTLGLRLWAILFFPVNWSISPGLLLGLTSIPYLACLGWLCTARVNRRRLWILLGYLLALALPPLQQLLIGTDLEKARYLYLPVAAFGLLLAAAVEQAGAKLRWTAAVAILAFHALALSHNLSTWAMASRQARSACLAVAVAAAAAAPQDRIAVVGLPRTLHGVYFFSNGFPECVEMQRQGQATAIDLPEDPHDHSAVFSWDPATQELRRIR